MAVMDELLERYGDAREIGVQVIVARGLNTKAGLLAGLGRPDGARVVDEDVVRRFGDSAESKLGEQVAVKLWRGSQALSGRGSPQ